MNFKYRHKLERKIAALFREYGVYCVSCRHYQQNEIPCRDCINRYRNLFYETNDIPVAGNKRK